MLESVVNQINQYVTLKDKKTVTKVIGIVLTRLTQVSVEQLQAINPETLQSFLSLVISCKDDCENPVVITEQLDKAYGVIEKFHHNRKKVLIDLEVELGNLLADYKRKTQNITKNESVSSAESKRVDTVKANSELTSLLLKCRQLSSLEADKQNNEKISAQCTQIDLMIIEYYRLQSCYWLCDSVWESIHQDINRSIGRNHLGTEFEKDHQKLVAKVNELVDMGLYEQAIKLLSYKGTNPSEPIRSENYPLIKLLVPINKVLEKDLAEKQTKKIPEGKWREHRAQLREMRKKASENLKAIEGLKGKAKMVAIRKIQQENRDTYISICLSMFERIQAVLGQPPLKFCILPSGSLSQGTSNTDSDIECIFVVENCAHPKIRHSMAKYLQNFSQIWNYETTALGESEERVAGFHLDCCPRVDFAGNDVVLHNIYTASEYAATVLKNFGKDNSTDSTQLRPILLFGDKKLYEKTIDEVSSNLNEALLKPVLQKTAATIDNPSVLDIGKPLEPKKKRLWLMTWLISQLALKHGLPKDHSTHPLDILKWLVTKEILDEQFAEICAKKLCWLYEQRMRQSLGLPQMQSNEQEKELKNIDEEILVPFSKLFGWMTESKQRKLGRKIHPGYYPNLNGERYQVKRDLLHWQQAVNQNYLAREAPSGLPAIKISTIDCGVGYLHPVILKQLQAEGWINAQGQFNFEMKKTSKVKGRHLVIPSLVSNCKLFLIVFPELPGMDYAASKLSQLFPGAGLPFVDIARFECNEEIYPVVLSQAAPGETMDISLKKQNKPSIDKRSFTIAFFLTLLMNPEDQKPDNIIHSLNTLLKLFLIDNGRSFYSVTDERWSIKSIIYCLDQMKEELDKSVIEEFLSTDPYLLLNTWLQELARAEAAIAKLFTNKEIASLYKEHVMSGLLKKTGVKQDLPETSLIPIPIREGMIAELYIKMLRIQEALRIEDNVGDEAERKSITAIAVLREIEPVLGHRYGELLDKYPDASARFNAGPGQAYAKSSKDTHHTQQTLPQTLRTMHGKPVELKALLAREKYFTVCVSKELSLTRGQYQRQKDIADRITNGDVSALKELEEMPILSIREQIINQLDFSAIKIAPEKIYKVMERTSFTKLRLINSSLTDEQLERIFKGSPYIRDLSLHNLPNISGKLWLMLDKYCKNLQQLYIDNLTALAWGTKKTITLAILRELQIKNCPQLEVLLLVAAELRKLVLCNLSKVQSDLWPVIESYYKRLEKLYIENLSSLMWFNGETPVISVKELIIINCQKLEEISLRLPALRRIKLQDCSNISTSTSTTSKFNFLGSILDKIEIVKCPKFDLYHTGWISIPTNTTSYDFSHSRLHPDIILDLYKKLTNVGDISSLVLCNCRVAYSIDPGMIKLRALLNVQPNLISLDLHFNLIGDEGAAGLSRELEINRSLTSLDLRNCSIKNIGAMALKDALIDNHALTDLFLNDETNRPMNAPPLSNIIDDSIKKEIEKLIERNRLLRDEFLMAAEKGDFEKVKISVERGVSIHVANQNGNTALHLAAKYGHFDVVLYLIEVNASIILGNKEGQTPLDIARLAKQDAVVSYLSSLSRVVNLNDTPASSGVDKYIMADEIYSNIDSLTHLNQSNATIALNLSGCSVTDDDAKTISTLLSKKLSIFELDVSNSNLRTDGFINICLALEQNETLVSFNAMGNHINENGMISFAQVLTLNSSLSTIKIAFTKLDFSLALFWGSFLDALEKNNALTDIQFNGDDFDEVARETVLRIMLRNRDLRDRFLHAARLGELENVCTCLDNGVSIHNSSDVKMTALHFAAQYGHLPIVKELKNRGASVKARNKAGQTPLDVARLAKQDAVVEYLTSLSAADQSRTQPTPKRASPVLETLSPPSSPSSSNSNTSSSDSSPLSSNSSPTSNNSNSESRDASPTVVGNNRQAFFTRGVAPSSRRAPVSSAAVAASAAAVATETKSALSRINP